MRRGGPKSPHPNRSTACRIGVVGVVEAGHDDVGVVEPAWSRTRPLSVGRSPSVKLVGSGVNEDRVSEARTVQCRPTVWSAERDSWFRCARQSEVLRSRPRVRFHLPGGRRGRVRARLQPAGRRHDPGRGPDRRVRGRSRPQERGSQERPLHVSRVTRGAAGSRVGPAIRVAYDIVAERRSAAVGRADHGHGMTMRAGRPHLMLFGCSLNAADDSNRDLEQAATRRYDVTAAAALSSVPL